MLLGAFGSGVGVLACAGAWLVAFLSSFLFTKPFLGLAVLSGAAAAAAAAAAGAGASGWACGLGLSGACGWFCMR